MPRKKAEKKITIDEVVGVVNLNADALRATLVHINECNEHLVGEINELKTRLDDAEAVIVRTRLQLAAHREGSDRLSWRTRARAWLAERGLVRG